MDIVTQLKLPMRDDPPLTPDSVALAKRVQADDRVQATADTWLQFDGDTPYVHVPLLTDGIPADTRDAVADALDALVEAYGVAAVLRCARLIAAANGVRLDV